MHPYLDDLRRRADAAKRRVDAARPQVELLRQQAEEEARRRKQAALDHERKRIAAESERRLKEALEEAANKGSREARIVCRKFRPHCSKNDEGSFFTLFSHVHNINCMDHFTQAIWHTAKANGLRVRLQRRVNWNCGYNGHSVGMHSETCVKYTMKIAF
jgi:hypothetical protein